MVEMTDDVGTTHRNEGEVIVKPDGDRCGVWVAHFADDPDSNTIEIGNVWSDKHRTQVTIPKSAAKDVVIALEERT